MTEKRPATASRGMVVTNHPLGSAAGAEMLAAGGNAVDAAIGALFALTVVEPMMVGIFGAGMTQLRLADGRHLIIDNYTTAPSAARPDMYRPISDAWPDYLVVEGDLNLVGLLSVGVPGTLMAWSQAVSRFGRLDLETVMQPAIRHAERGFRPDQSTVTLVAACTMIQVWNYGTHEQLLRAIGDAISYLGSIAILGQTPAAVVLGGEHTELLRASGWNKRQIREFVVAHTGRSIADLKRTGRIDGAVTAADEKTLHYAMDIPDELMLICAGSAIGAMSMVLPGFGSSKTAGRSPPILIEEGS